jgi:hypothetical protein
MNFFLKRQATTTQRKNKFLLCVFASLRLCVKMTLARHGSLAINKLTCLSPVCGDRGKSSKNRQLKSCPRLIQSIANKLDRFFIPPNDCSMKQSEKNPEQPG